MWYIRSGALQGVSRAENWEEAFIELFDAYLAQTGRFPDLGILGAASQAGFDFQADNTSFFLSEWALFMAKRIPKMSHEFNSPQEHMASLFEAWPGLDEALKLAESGQSEILEAKVIDAPNSKGDNWVDEWDNVIEVPDDYEWPQDTADGDASLSGS
jgi:hypothetical protein